MTAKVLASVNQDFILYNMGGRGNQTPPQKRDGKTSDELLAEFMAARK